MDRHIPRIPIPLFRHYSSITVGYMDGLTYTIEERAGASVAVGTFAPPDGISIYFEVPFTDEGALHEQVVWLQGVHAGLRD